MRVSQTGPFAVAQSPPTDFEAELKKLEEQMLAPPAIDAETPEEGTGDALSDETKLGLERLAQFLAQQKPLGRHRPPRPISRRRQLAVQAYLRQQVALDEASDTGHLFKKAA